jgi:hypothetical protein
MDVLRVPFVLHWAGTPKPDLSGFIDPICVPFRFVPRDGGEAGFWEQRPGGSGPGDRLQTTGDLDPEPDRKPSGELGSRTDPNLLLAGSWTREVNGRTARGLGMSKRDLSDALHSLKAAVGLRGSDNVLIEIPSGDVYYGDEKIGNLFDEL